MNFFVQQRAIAINKLLLIIAFTSLAVASFFLRCKSYHPSFLIFTSDKAIFERVADIFWGCTSWGKLFFLTVFTPAFACGIFQTKLEKFLPVLLVASLISPAFLFFVDFGLQFELFAVQEKNLFGYYLFQGLGALGCLMLWALTVREIWRRFNCWYQKRKILSAAAFLS